jgi:4-hydroxybenzoate polyprenyltransferase
MTTPTPKTEGLTVAPAKGISAWVRLLRVRQWTKNLLVFAAALFTGQITQGGVALRVLLGFAAMCFISSAVYIFNDLRDIELDRSHARKRHRPLASGAIKPLRAGILALVLVVGGLGLAFWLNRWSLIVGLTYLGLQVLYNLWLKHEPVADIFCISVGFVLRAVLGAVVISVTISPWLLFCTGSLALMLGFAKRRQEFLNEGPDAKTRPSLASYTKDALDRFVVVFATSSLLCYGLYCIESTTAKQHPGLAATAIFVAYGVCRYLLIVFGSKEGEEPETLLFSDRRLLLSVVLFMLTAAIAVLSPQYSGVLK